MQIIMGLVLIGLCIALIRYARPSADGTIRAPFGSDAAAGAAIMLVTVFGSFGVMLIAFWATGITFFG